MYRVILVNLSADATALDAGAGRNERPRVSSEQLRTLLHNFGALDPVEAAAVEPEMRVESPVGSWLVIRGPKTLLLYDTLNREAAGQSLAPDEVMAEIDGTATAARVERYMTAAPFPVREVPPPAPVLPPAGPRRVRILGAISVLLLLGVIGLRLAVNRDEAPADFRKLPGAQAAAQLQAMSGVYLVGSQPGQHGLVVSPEGDVRLFEFRAIEPPRVVHARGVPGQSGDRPCLALDQPGGLLLVQGAGSVVYCGETYQRLP